MTLDISFPQALPWMRQKLERFPAASRDLGEVLSLFVRVGLKSGLLAKTTPRAIGSLLPAFFQGKASPSTLYRFQALCQPQREAIRWHEQVWTFAQLDEHIDRLCAGLQYQGLGQGDRALIVLKNRPEFIALLPALSRLGAAGVAVSWRSTPSELVYLAKHSGAKALFFEFDNAPAIRQALSELPGLVPERVFSVGGLTPGLASYEELLTHRPIAGLDKGDESAVIIYTSGTTGRPKGAVRKFPRDVVRGTLSVLLAAPLMTEDTHLALLPFYHSTAFAFTSFSHLVGATVVIADEFTPEGFLQTVEREGITQTALVPTLLHRLLKAGPQVLKKYRTSSLQAVMTAGAPLSAQLANRFMDSFGEILYNFYGATETGLITMAAPEDLRTCPGTIGRIIPGNEIRLLDEKGQEVAQGQIGELYARGPLLVAGYHQDEESTQASIREGFFSVGDLAWQDSRGCYHLAGRNRDMIISGGVNVYPAEVEAVLESHPEVLEAAVVGVPDEEWGERVQAYLVSASPESPKLRASVEQHCKSRLMGPKRPREYVFVQDLPRNPTGKVLKSELRQR